MVYLLERKATWAMVNLITAFTIISSFWLKQKGRNARICKLYCMVDVIYFFRSICKRKKHIGLYPESTVPRNRPKFWRKSQGSTLVKNLEKFWKTITEFDYRMMRRIMLISEAFTYPPWMIILLDLDNYPHHTQLYSTTWSGGTRWEMNCLFAETFLVRSRDGISTGSFCRYRHPKEAK